MKKVLLGLVAVGALGLIGCDRGAKQAPVASPSVTPISSPSPEPASDGSDLDQAILGTATTPSPTPQTTVDPEPVEAQPTQVIEPQPILEPVQQGAITATVYPDCRFKGAWIRQSTSTQSKKVGWIACTQQVSITRVNSSWYAYGQLGYLHKSTVKTDY